MCVRVSVYVYADNMLACMRVSVYVYADNALACMRVYVCLPQIQELTLSHVQAHTRTYTHINFAHEASRVA